MKRILPLVIAWIAPVLLFSFVRVVAGGTSEEEEINKLIETATTPEDHTKIADYYEKQAEKMEAKARSHTSMAASYRTRAKPLTEHFQLDQKRMYIGLAIHCSNLSDRYKEAAEEYSAMAMEHREIAKKMQKE